MYTQLRIAIVIVIAISLPPKCPITTSLAPNAPLLMRPPTLYCWADDWLAGRHSVVTLAKGTRYTP